MRYCFFTVNAFDPGEGTEKLNAFLGANSVLSVERQFVADGANSFWSVCVSVAKENVPESRARSKRGVDYRDVLNPEHFAIYARLRTLRNSLAEEQGTPAYAIFTNEQLAAMAQLNEFSLNALSAIEGIGEKRLSLYGDAFLAELERANG
jgi:superfamily II DNA helicase RecQ